MCLAREVPIASLFSLSCFGRNVFRVRDLFAIRACLRAKEGPLLRSPPTTFGLEFWRMKPRFRRDFGFRVQRYPLVSSKTGCARPSPPPLPDKRGEGRDLWLRACKGSLQALHGCGQARRPRSLASVAWIRSQPHPMEAQKGMSSSPGIRARSGPVLPCADESRNFWNSPRTAEQTASCKAPEARTM